MPITITILGLTSVPSFEGLPAFRHADIEITDGVDTYALGVGNLSPTLDLAGVQANLDGRADELWLVAQDTSTTAGILDQLSQRQLFKALIELLVDEINILRVEAGLGPRTRQQVVNGLRSKIIELLNA